MLPTNLIAINLRNSIPDLIAMEYEYQTKANSGDLIQINAFNRGGSIIINQLTRENFINLYEYYLRNKKTGNGRKIYEKLIANANEKCPLCGHIGYPSTLDHFMPKAKYPQFSILPMNLIPSCKDCNLGEKGDNFAQTKEDQLIHPFFEADHFFNEQWVFAKYHPANNNEPSYATFSVIAPKHWSDVDKRRVEKHFSIFNLAKRYSTEAAKELHSINIIKESFLKKGDIENFKDAYLRPIAHLHPNINYWKVSLYKELLMVL